MTEEQEFYCPICESCGDEFCCKPTVCKGSGGLYCNHNLTILKETYDKYIKLFNLIYETKNQDFINLLNQIDDE